MKNLFGIRTHSKPLGAVGGTLLAEYLDGGRVVERQTVMCAHCGAHGIYRPGAGKSLGWCGRCAAYTCPTCAQLGECVPVEQYLENLEAGMSHEEARRFRPVSVSVPVEVPNG